MATRKILVNVHKPKSNDRRTKLTVELIRAFRIRFGRPLYFHIERNVIVATTYPPQSKTILFSVIVDGENRTRLTEAKLKKIGATFGDVLEFNFIAEGKAVVRVHPKQSDDEEQSNFLLPEELEGSRTYIEGASKQITINAYERDPRARRASIKHYGLNCYVCDFNFEEFYGDVGKDYIHVHHLKPLSSVGKQYEPDPIVDLRPVCPNCHAMLHRKRPPYTIEEMQRILRTTR